MDSLSRLERAVLHAIAAQASESTAVLNHQVNIARVATRENTGAGFYTTLNVDTDRLLDGLRSPVGDVGASVAGLRYKMDFLLWIKDGLIHKLEGYANGDKVTSGLDFEQVDFRDVEPR